MSHNNQIEEYKVRKLAFGLIGLESFIFTCVFSVILKINSFAWGLVIFIIVMSLWYIPYISGILVIISSLFWGIITYMFLSLLDSSIIPSVILAFFASAFAFGIHFLIIDTNEVKVMKNFILKTYRICKLKLKNLKSKK